MRAILQFMFAEVLIKKKNQMKKLVIFTVVTLIFSSCKIKIESGLADTSEFLNTEKNSISIYDTNSNHLLMHPFNFASTDYGSLLFINIDNHPEIKTIELVVQENGVGSFIVVYYKNGKVECYPNPELTADRKFLMPNDDWTVMPENNYDFLFIEDKKGLKASFEITIKNNILISVALNSNSAKQVNSSFLAAIGADLSEVKRFPLIYLENAGFLPVEDTEFNIKIDNKIYSLKKIPITVDGVKCYKTVYSFNPQPFFWNEECDGDLPYEKFEGQVQDTIGNIIYSYYNNQGYSEIKEVTYQLSDKKMKITFSPALPNLKSLADNVKVNGKFSVDVNTNECVIGGSYQVECNKKDISLSINPEKGWQPMPGNSWVSHYNYVAHFKASGEMSYRISSEWKVQK